VVSEALLPTFQPLLARLPKLKHVIVAGPRRARPPAPRRLMAAASDQAETAATALRRHVLWLYTSGSTGTPKGRCICTAI